MKLVITTQEVRLGTHRASHADFTVDYGSAPPPPAHPNCTRIYEHGVLHASQTPGAQLAGGPCIWPEGDAIIAALPTLLAKQKARQDAARAAAEAVQAAQQAAQEAAQQAAQSAQSAQKVAQEAAQQAAQSAQKVAQEAAQQAAQAAQQAEKRSG